MGRETFVKVEKEGFLVLRKRAAVRRSCFEFPMERWVEHVSLFLLSGREMLSDEASRERVFAEATHLAGGVCGILLWDQR